MNGALEGYVYRQNGGKNKNWQKLWLKWDHSKRMLIIMKNPDSEHLEYIPISEWIGATVDMSVKSKYYNFNICTGNCIYKLATEKIEERNDWIEYLIQLMEKRDYGDLNIELSIPKRNIEDPKNSNFVKAKKKFIISNDKENLSSSLPDLSLGGSIPRKEKEDSQPKSVRTKFYPSKEDGMRNTFHGDEYLMDIDRKKNRHMVTGLKNEDISNLHDFIEKGTTDSDIWKQTNDDIDSLIQKYRALSEYSYGHEEDIETKIIQSILQFLFDIKQKVISEVCNNNILSDKTKDLFKNIQLMKSSISSKLNSLRIENETTKKIIEFLEMNDELVKSINTDMVNMMNNLHNNFSNLETKVDGLSKSNEKLNSNVEDMMINTTFSMSEFLTLDVELLKKNSIEKDMKIAKLEKVVVYQQNEINSLKVELDKQYSLMNEKIKQMEETIKNLGIKY